MIQILYVGAYVAGFGFGYGSSPLTKLDRVRLRSLTVSVRPCVNGHFIIRESSNSSEPMRAVRSETINAAQPIRSMGRRLLLDAMVRCTRMRNPDKWAIGPHAADMYRGETCPKRGRGGAAPTEPKRNRLACEPILQGAMSGPCTAA